jgi:hypothetical protein
MKRLLVIGSVTWCVLSLPLAAACAADDYDGEWTGGATAMSGRCQPAVVTLTVEGKVVTGQATFVRDVANIHGTILEEGSFGATVGFRHLKGKFAQEMFEGTFSAFNCAWKMTLKKKKQ